MKLFSLRYSHAWGHHWRYERDVSPDTAAAWLAVFRKDEPTVQFTVAHRAPRTNNQHRRAA